MAKQIGLLTQARVGESVLGRRNYRGKGLWVRREGKSPAVLKEVRIEQSELVENAMEGASLEARPSFVVQCPEGHRHRPGSQPEQRDDNNNCYPRDAQD